MSQSSTQTQSVVSQSLRDWFNRRRVGQKITAGYMIAFGCAIGGTLLGVAIGNQYQQPAWREVRRVSQANTLLNDLQTAAVKVNIFEQKMLGFANNNEDSAFVINQLMSQEHPLAVTWSKMQILSLSNNNNSGADEKLAKYIKLNNQVVTLYFYELRLLQQRLKNVKSIDSKNVTQQRQELLFAFGESRASQDFDRLIQDLVQQVITASTDARKAEEQIQAAHQMATNITIISLFTSTVIAAGVGLLISRTIIHSLKQVEAVAQAIVAGGDFERRCEITSEDEIGSLARSLNQLIVWAGEHSHGLEVHRQQLEAIVYTRTQELNAIIDCLGDGLLVCDDTGVINRFNPAFGQLLNLAPGQLQGKYCHDVLGDDLLALIQQHDLDPHPMTAMIQLSDNRVGQALITPMISESKYGQLSIDGSVILVRDVTVEQEVDRMKTDFLSTVSHELRTPLTSVIGFAKLIHKKLEDVILPAVPLDEKKMQRSVNQVRDNLRIIVSEGERLTSLINDVLDIAKIESGKVEWHINPTNITELLEQAIGATSVLSDSAGLRVVQVIEPDLVEVLADRDRIVQVLINLLSNAIKFTNAGDITCRVATRDNQVVVSITDTGVGLTLDDCERVFEKFKQVGEVMTDKPKGTGLGLPICKQIIEHHGGQIWAESTLGVGSTFNFTLPIATAMQPQISPHLHQLVQKIKESVEISVPIVNQAEQKTILVVDDEPAIRQLLLQELESHGYLVQEATDGRQALDMIRKASPDLIIADVMMPNINGFDLVAILKHTPETMMIPVLVLSIVEEQQRGYQLGVDCYQAKPINMELLLHNISTLIAKAGQNERVLLIDGATMTVDTLMQVLLDRGYDLVDVWAGQVGIDQAMAAAQPNLIIIDSGVPGRQIEKPNALVKTLRLVHENDSVFFILLDRSHPTDVTSSAPPPAQADASAALTEV
jgi:signal transduction histidine kinase/DNA-binding response OmpR family regulator/HAMP domain-containing protein